MLNSMAFFTKAALLILTQLACVATAILRCEATVFTRWADERASSALELLPRFCVPRLRWILFLACCARDRLTHSTETWVVTLHLL